MSGWEAARLDSGTKLPQSQPGEYCAPIVTYIWAGPGTPPLAIFEFPSSHGPREERVLDVHVGNPLQPVDASECDC